MESPPSIDEHAAYVRFFECALGTPPLPYQARLVSCAQWPARIEVPTGLGKTAAVVLAHLFRQTRHPRTEPRRLVYCLPMRVLVEQTIENIRTWLDRLGLSASVRLAMLMGGAIDSTWDLHPDRPAILVGTQDQLLSRALNRGYSMSRYRWPMHFGLLHNDCRWIIDEVQLAGSGLATTVQLQALRRLLGTIRPVETSWMSATIDERWLSTIDAAPPDSQGREALDHEDLANEVVRRRTGARKALSFASARIDDVSGLAAEVLAAHRPGTRSLVIVNTVDRAIGLFEALRKRKPQAELLLIHSRFRGPERAAATARLVAAPDAPGQIAVTTQVVEAGVDISARTLFSDAAPWASLVQRFGRCNRRGEYDDAADPATVRVVRLPSDEKLRAKHAAPYELAQIAEAESVLAELRDVGPASLPRRPMELAPGALLRRRDLLDLFDTTPDLMGNDVDVSRFIRDGDDHDIRVYWRDFEGAPGDAERWPQRDELCAAPVAVGRDWMKKGRRMWIWRPLDGEFAAVEAVRPGMVLLLRSRDGGYEPQSGLAPRSDRFVTPVPLGAVVPDDDSDREDLLSLDRPWYTLRAHSDDAAAQADALATAIELPEPLHRALTDAARWHDAGKNHPAWQGAIRAGSAVVPSEPMAKSRTGRGALRYLREGEKQKPVAVPLRHELASGLMALQHGKGDLVAFLIACHHGKVRLSIRSTPTEPRPPEAGRRFARGVWEGDVIPATDLGAGVMIPATALTLSYMELGEDDRTGPSWLARTLALRDDAQLGPFRLAFLEALIKAADERASILATGQELP